MKIWVLQKNRNVLVYATLAPLTEALSLNFFSHLVEPRNCACSQPHSSLKQSAVIKLSANIL